MMANPIPLVPYHYEGMEEINIVQPKSIPRPIAVFEPVVVEKEKEEPAIEMQELQTPEDEVKVIVEQPKVEVKPSPEIVPVSSLADLEFVDRLSVCRRLQVREVLSCKGKRNQFQVKTPQGQVVYSIQEENIWWVGYVCYGMRPLELKVCNGEGVEVMRIKRPYNFTCRIMPCQLQRLEVFSPPDKLIGRIMQQWTPVRPLFLVKDNKGTTVFEVHGPLITLSCFQDVRFEVKRPSGEPVAAVNKHWEGLVHALFFAPVMDKYAMSFFDKGMKAEEKALLLATSLLFDYLYYDV